MMIVTWLQSKALMILAVLAVLVGAYAMGGRASRRSAQKQHDYDEALRTAAGAKGVHDAETEVRAMPTGGAADELRNDWVRDDEAGAERSTTSGRRDGT